MVPVLNAMLKYVVWQGDNMKAIVKRDILSVLKKAQLALQKKDSDMMKRTSNETIHNASIFQDQGSISIAVLTYAMSKLMHRDLLDPKRAQATLQMAEHQLNENDVKAFTNTIHVFMDHIAKVDRKFPEYVMNVTEFAHLKKACLMCKHGISVAQAADASGKTQWELLPIVASQSFNNEASPDVPARQRVKWAREFFK